MPSIRILLVLTLAQSVSYAQIESPKRLLESRDLAPVSSGGATTLFEEVPPTQSGIVHQYDLQENHPLRRLYAFGWFTGAPCIGDLDGDGKADLFLAGTNSPNRLYLQTNDFQFTEQAVIAGVDAPSVWASGATLVDIDNDDDLDIFLPVFNQANRLYLNESTPGSPKFTEAAKEWGLDGSDGSLNANFADFDRDGDLDLYLQTYHLEPESGRPDEEMKISVDRGVPVVPRKWQAYYSAYYANQKTIVWSEAGRPDFLMMNNGPGLPFSDVTREAGLYMGRNYGTSIAWWDVDHNFWPDLFVGSDFEDPDLLYFNGGKRGIVQATPAMLPSTSWKTRGVAVADFNGDLRVDLVTADTAPVDPADHLAHIHAYGNYGQMSTPGGLSQVLRNSLYLNTGTVRLIEAAQLAGIDRTGASWAVKAADFDLDGAVDLFFANGSPRDPLAKTFGELSGQNLVGKTRWDLLDGLPSAPEPDQIYRNQGDAKFVPSNAAWGIGKAPSVSGGAAVGDLDGDGDPDLVVCRLGEPVAVYRNHATGNRVTIELEGQGSNRAGVGAELLVELPDGTKQMRQLWPMNGFLGTDEGVFHLGLGSADRLAKMTIYWPNGAPQTYENLVAGKRYIIREAATLIEPVDRGGVGRDGRSIFSTSDAFGKLLMQERTYSDFNLQPFLPNEMSHFGPPVAWADLDGDGRSEAFIGGPAAFPARLVSQSVKMAKLAQSFTNYASVEDMGSVFFDADGDGDQDLFIAGGGVEVEKASIALKDRLLLNDGNGQLNSSEEGALPNIRESSGPVAAADFDRDGDIDLFVGARVRIGAYPKGGKSYLLLNDGKGNFSEATPPALADSGMVTSVLWSDADGDGWLDLLTTAEWGPVRMWKNVNGTLADGVDIAGNGRWNGITGRDTDNDGDIDYLVTNFGLNTPYGTGENKIAHIYHGDFGAKEGVPFLLEAFSRSGKQFSRIPYADMLSRIEGFADRYSDARSYGRATIEEIFGAEKIKAATHRHLDQLATGLLVNDGTGQFSFLPLPDSAQIAPAFGGVLTDLNFDGLTDVMVAQNLMETPIDFGPFNGGVAAVMLGTGDPANPFRSISAAESGIIVQGAGRSVTTSDFDNDSRVDLVVGINGSPAVTYMNQGASDEFRPIAIQVRSKGKSPIGARVTVKAEGLPPQTAEYYAGEGHLSQSTPILFFGARRDSKSAVEVEFRWPDGTTNRRKLYQPEN